MTPHFHFQSRPGYLPPRQRYVLRLQPLRCSAAVLAALVAMTLAGVLTTACSAAFSAAWAQKATPPTSAAAPRPAGEPRAAPPPHPDHFDSTGQADRRSAEPLSAEQRAKVKVVLAPYQPGSVTADDAKAIKRGLRDAGLRRSPALDKAIADAGFSPERLEALDPRPQHPPQSPPPHQPPPDGPPNGPPRR